MSCINTKKQVIDYCEGRRKALVSMLITIIICPLARQWSVREYWGTSRGRGIIPNSHASPRIQTLDPNKPVRPPLEYSLHVPSIPVQPPLEYRLLVPSNPVQPPLEYRLLVPSNPVQPP